MTDKELADKVVALGVGQKDSHQKALPYLAPDSTQWDEDELFVRDWRVAGALMEKCRGLMMKLPSVIGKADRICLDPDESLPRAIIEACAEALQHDD